MSKVEIVFIILLSLTPIFALLFSFKFKFKFRRKDKLNKKDKTEKLTEAETIDNEQLDNNPSIQEESVACKDNKIYSNSISHDYGDFKGYLREKSQNLSRAEKIEHSGDFEDRTMPYRPKFQPIPRLDKPIYKQIENLSPELKALLVSGILNKKEY